MFGVFSLDGLFDCPGFPNILGQTKAQAPKICPACARNSKLVLSAMWVSNVHLITAMKTENEGGNHRMPIPKLFQAVANKLQTMVITKVLLTLSEEGPKMPLYNQ